MQNKLVKELDFEEAEEILIEKDGIREFSPIQSQVFDKLYLGGESIFIGLP